MISSNTTREGRFSWVGLLMLEREESVSRTHWYVTALEPQLFVARRRGAGSAPTQRPLSPASRWTRSTFLLPLPRQPHRGMNLQDHRPFGREKKITSRSNGWGFLLIDLSSLDRSAMSIVFWPVIVRLLFFIVDYAWLVEIVVSPIEGPTPPCPRFISFPSGWSDYGVLASKGCVFDRYIV